MADTRAMPSFDKSPAALLERFDAVIAERPRVSARKMFGYPAGFVNGNLATGLFAEGWFVRLSEADTSQLRAIGGSPFEPMAGRPMRGYTLLPSAIAVDPSAAGAWVDRACDHVATLPPK